MTGFDDLLANNAHYAESFTQHGFDGIARVGVGVVTCMDSRIEPLGMLGLELGDAKIIRTPGGHVTDEALRACVLAVQLLGVERLLVIEHTRCAVASTDDDGLRAKIAANGGDASQLSFGADPDQETHLRADVERLRAEPLTNKAEIGGFLYDVDSGRLTRVC